MLHAKRWSVEIFIDEDEDCRCTRAQAQLHSRDDTHLIGQGTARRNPVDREVPEIGDELAVARALGDLAHQLLEAAAGDIEAITHRPAQLNA